MMRPALPNARTPKLAVLFLVVVGLPAVALVWLGTQLASQERTLVAQRERERAQSDLQAAALMLEKLIAGAAQSPPEGAARFTFTEAGISAEPRNGVLWLPKIATLQAADDLPFAEAERAEYLGDFARALATYRRLSAASLPTATRAGALLRLGRIHWREKRWDGALRAYSQLAGFTRIGIEGLPADFVALRARCSVLQDAGRGQQLAQEAEKLREDLLGNRWMLDQSSWELAASQIMEWTGRRVEIPNARRALSEAARWAWEHRGEAPQRGATTDGQTTTFLWDRQRGEVSVVAIPALVLDAWLARVIPRGANRITLLSQSGTHIAGPKVSRGPRGLQAPPAETGLPWLLVASSDPARPSAPEVAARQRILIFGLGALVLLIAGAGFLLWRLVQRELAVARLQTDFVAAVSHEFRTPLASLRHVTELLSEDDELPRERRRGFYDSLGRNTDRLQRLVESLLDFARMEDERKPYDLRPLDAGKLTAEVVSEFRKEAQPRGFTVDLSLDGEADLPVRADPASLGNALWNLLDNAVKYSPGGSAIHVAVERERRGVSISVEDHGIGIPEFERKEIFRKFVRGHESKRLGIKGTGLGLAMVTHIVEAHGGAVEVESKEGSGSTFRIVLPERG